MSYRLAVFDFDGTLVDTSVAIVKAARAALGGAGFSEPDAKEVRLQVGLPLEVVMGNLAGGAQPREVVADLCHRYRAQFQKGIGEAARPFDGARRAVAELQRSGVDMAVATSRLMGSLEEILVAVGMRSAFATLITDGCVNNGKPHPEMLLSVMDRFGVRPGETLMIGDTIFDIRMGRAAGCDTCAVMWGFHPAEELVAEEPTHVARHASELPGIVLKRSSG